VIRRESEVLVRVRDDGKRISEKISELRPDSIGVGIGGMSQRAKEFGGELRVTNAHPGTIVEAVIPCRSPVLQETVVSA
jgi:signal transduction histidine kinase